MQNKKLLNMVMLFVLSLSTLGIVSAAEKKPSDQEYRQDQQEERPLSGRPRRRRLSFDRVSPTDGGASTVPNVSRVGFPRRLSDRFSPLEVMVSDPEFTCSGPGLHSGARPVVWVTPQKQITDGRHLDLLCKRFAGNISQHLPDSNLFKMLCKLLFKFSTTEQEEEVARLQAACIGCNGKVIRIGGKVAKASASSTVLSLGQATCIAVDVLMEHQDKITKVCALADDMAQKEFESLAAKSQERANFIERVKELSESLNLRVQTLTEEKRRLENDLVRINAAIDRLEKDITIVRDKQRAIDGLLLSDFSMPQENHYNLQLVPMRAGLKDLIAQRNEIARRIKHIAHVKKARKFLDGLADKQLKNLLRGKRHKVQECLHQLDPSHAKFDRDIADLLPQHFGNDLQRIFELGKPGVCYAMPSCAQELVPAMYVQAVREITQIKEFGCFEVDQKAVDEWINSLVNILVSIRDSYGADGVHVANMLLALHRLQLDCSLNIPLPTHFRDNPVLNPFEAGHRDVVCRPFVQSIRAVKLYGLVHFQFNRVEDLCKIIRHSVFSMRKAEGFTHVFDALGTTGNWAKAISVIRDQNSMLEQEFLEGYQGGDSELCSSRMLVDPEVVRTYFTNSDKSFEVLRARSANSREFLVLQGLLKTYMASIAAKLNDSSDPEVIACYSQTLVRAYEMLVAYCDYFRPHGCQRAVITTGKKLVILARQIQALLRQYRDKIHHLCAVDVDSIIANDRFENVFAVQESHVSMLTLDIGVRDGKPRVMGGHAFRWRCPYHLAVDPEVYECEDANPAIQAKVYQLLHEQGCVETCQEPHLITCNQVNGVQSVHIKTYMVDDAVEKEIGCIYKKTTLPQCFNANFYGYLESLVTCIDKFNTGVNLPNNVSVAQLGSHESHAPMMLTRYKISHPHSFMLDAKQVGCVQPCTISPEASMEVMVILATPQDPTSSLLPVVVTCFPLGVECFNMGKKQKLTEVLDYFEPDEQAERKAVVQRTFPMREVVAQLASKQLACLADVACYDEIALRKKEQTFHVTPEGMASVQENFGEYLFMLPLVNWEHRFARCHDFSLSIANVVEKFSEKWKSQCFKTALGNFIAIECKGLEATFSNLISVRQLTSICTKVCKALPTGSVAETQKFTALSAMYPLIKSVITMNKQLHAHLVTIEEKLLTAHSQELEEVAGQLKALRTGTRAVVRRIAMACKRLASDIAKAKHTQESMLVLQELKDLIASTTS